MQNPKSILIICTANICRSPFAEALLKKKLKDKEIENVIVSSCGVDAIDDYPAVKDAKKIAKEYGVDLSSHLSKHVSEDLLKENDLILVMENDHKNKLIQKYSQFESKIKILAEFSNKNKKQRDVMDPYGHNERIYKITFDDIEDCIDGLVEQLKENSKL